MLAPVRDNAARSHFEFDADGVTAFMNYRLVGDGVISLDHTETPVAARGRGIASRLVKGALDIARARLPVRARLSREASGGERSPGIAGHRHPEVRGVAHGEVTSTSLHSAHSADFRNGATKTPGRLFGLQTSLAIHALPVRGARCYPKAMIGESQG